MNSGHRLRVTLLQTNKTNVVIFKHYHVENLAVKVKHRPTLLVYADKEVSQIRLFHIHA